MKVFNAIEDPRSIRKKLGMNQQEFWEMVGTTQSGGSRYESGRRMPKATAELVRIVHIEGVHLSKIKGIDLAIAEKLKQSAPEQYKALKKEAKKSRNETTWK